MLQEDIIPRGQWYGFQLLQNIKDEEFRFITILIGITIGVELCLVRNQNSVTQTFIKTMMSFVFGVNLAKISNIPFLIIIKME